MSHPAVFVRQEDVLAEEHQRAWFLQSSCRPDSESKPTSTSTRLQQQTTIRSHVPGISASANSPERYQHSESSCLSEGYFVPTTDQKDRPTRSFV